MTKEMFMLEMNHKSQQSVCFGSFNENTSTELVPTFFISIAKMGIRGLYSYISKIPGSFQMVSILEEIRKNKR